MKYTKNCPKCNKIQTYTRKYTALKAIKNNTLCTKCSKRSQLKHKGPFEKQCPNCGEKMIYSAYSSLLFSIKANSKCRKCCVKQQPIYTPEEKIKKIRERRKRYTLNNKEKIKQKNKEYYQKNKELMKEKSRIFKQNNKEHYQKYFREYAHTNKKQLQKYQVDRRKNNIVHRLNHNISCSMSHCLKLNKLSKKNSHWEDVVGYTAQDLKEHIEKLFLPGMSWDNYGEWHIDHIIPKSFFVYTSTNDVEFKYCWSLLNLQPLWAKDNLEKHDKLPII